MTTSAEAEAEEAAQANNGKDNNGKDGAGGKKIGKKEKKEKEKKEKEKLEEERKRRDSKEDASMAKNKRKSSDGGLNGKANGKKEKDKIRGSLGKGELNGADSNGRQGGKRWRKKERKEKGKEKKDQENGSRGNESDDGEEERSSDYSEEVKKVTLKIGEEEFPSSLEVHLPSTNPRLLRASLWRPDTDAWVMVVVRPGVRGCVAAQVRGDGGALGQVGRRGGDVPGRVGALPGHELPGPLHPQGRSRVVIKPPPTHPPPHQSGQPTSVSHKIGIAHVQLFYPSKLLSGVGVEVFIWG